MKKKFFSCLLLTVFACVALFSFAACSSDQNISGRLDALESNMDALEAKVKALEAANANFQQQLNESELNAECGAKFSPYKCRTGLYSSITFLSKAVRRRANSTVTSSRS